MTTSKELPGTPRDSQGLQRTPKDAQGLVTREVVRVLSPGTITDEKLLGQKANNFLAAVIESKGTFGLAWIDVSTGQFLVWETQSLPAVCAQLTRLEPAECLLPESLAFTGLDNLQDLKTSLDSTAQTPYGDPFFDVDFARTTLTDHFRTRTLEGFGCEHMRLGLRAGGGLLHYVSSTQGPTAKGNEALNHVTKVSPFLSNRFVPIDRPTRLALELMENPRGGGRGTTVLQAFDTTCSSLGARKLRDWLLTPLTDVGSIVERQDAVSELAEDTNLRTELRDLLRQVHDLERICSRIAYRSANARDLVSLRRTLEIMPAIRTLVGNLEPALLQKFGQELEPLPALVEEIGATLVEAPPLTITEGGLVREGFDETLDELREISTQGTRWIARFQHEEIERTGISSLKIGYNKVFGYYLEVTNTHRERVPEHYLRKQTLKNCERFITSELKEYEAKVLKATERAVELEYDIFSALRDRAALHISALQNVAETLAQIDVLANFAAIAAERGYARPLVNDGTRLYIKDGRHPVLERLETSESFVPNTIDLDDDRRVMLITGPNMAGKSTYIRQVAILTLLAQVGSFIPAKEAEIGVVDRVFTRVGAADDLTRGQSTFMVEMNETANILNNATSRSLLILDEVGRGTSTFDGVSLAWAIVEVLAGQLGARSLFATHYHELTALAESFPSVRNYNFAVKEWNDEIIFLRKVVEGSSDKSYGIHVARLAGIPPQVLDRAREILSNLESQNIELLEPAPRAKETTPGETHRQLDMFQDRSDAVLREIRRLDVNEMTPVQALQYLAELQKRII